MAELRVSSTDSSAGVTRHYSETESLRRLGRSRSWFRRTLGAVAEDLGLGSKLHMPSGTSSKFEILGLIRYNIVDSSLEANIFIKLEIGKRIMSSCSVMKSCFLDAVRNATGVMCLHVILVRASQRKGFGLVQDDSRTRRVGRQVDFRGFREEVAVVDFKSMYPYKLLCASISHDNVSSYVDETNSSYDATWCNMGVTVKLPDSTIFFKHDEECIATSVFRTLIEFRSV